MWSAIRFFALRNVLHLLWGASSYGSAPFCGHTVYLQKGNENMKTRRTRLGLLALLVLLLLALTTTAFAAPEDPTELTGTKYVECPDCGALGVVLSDDGQAIPCETCADSGYVGYIQSPSRFFNTIWSLLPPHHRHRPGVDHQGGVLLPVHRHSDGRPALLQLQL